MERKTKIQIFSIVMVLAILVLGFSMMKTIQDNSKCSVNPFVYSAIRLSTEGKNVMCSCESSNLETFWFDNQTIYFESPYYLENPYYNNLWVNYSL